MICRNCGSEIGQGETFCRHCAYSCKHDSSTISVKVSVSGNSSARAIRNPALRATHSYYSRNRHVQFALVALTGSSSVLRTKTAHMGGGSCFTGSQQF